MSRTSPCRSIILCFAFLGIIVEASHAQVRPRVQAGWGATYLISPGHEIQSLPGRTGFAGIGIDIGGESRMRFQPAINYVAAAYRSSLAYRIAFVSTRSAVDLDLLLGFPQMNRTTIQAGIFGGRTTSSNAYIEQKGQNNLGGAGMHAVRTAHLAHSMRAGLVLGLAIPLGAQARFGLDIRLRQHIIPLVESDQYHALINQAPQQVLATNTRASELTVGLGYLLK